MYSSDDDVDVDDDAGCIDYRMVMNLCIMIIPILIVIFIV